MNSKPLNNGAHSATAGSRVAVLGNEEAFTLLEVLVSMFILLFIGIAIYQTTTKTFELRDALTNEGDFYNGIRLSMDILQRDLMLMYSPTLILPQAPAPSGTPAQSVASAVGVQPNAIPSLSPQDQQELAQTSPDLLNATDFFEPAVDKTGTRPMRFKGTATKISFVSVSHIRIYKDSPESDFAKITYELLRDDGNTDYPDAQVLVKSESPNAFQDNERNDKARRSFPLLHGVRKLAFRFYGKDKDKPLTSWDTDAADTKNLYPEMIELTIDIGGPTHLSWDGLYFFRPEVPLAGINPSG